MHGTSLVISVATFVAVSSLALLMFTLLSKSDPRVRGRLEELGEFHNSRPSTRRSDFKSPLRDLFVALGRRLLPGGEEQNRLRTRLIQAGVYGAAAPAGFAAVKFLLTVLPPVAALVAAQLTLCQGRTALIVGALGGLLGMLAPGFWLDRRRRARQSTLRRSLPDFLDLMVACLESGMSLEGALQRVSDELQTAHAMLAREMRIVEREMALGQPPDDALRNMSERTGLDAVRVLSTFVQQARRFGSSMSESLRTHADMLRVQREQQAEERAQKAAVKILFPTLLFIFPALFVVLIGPAVIDLQEKFLAPPGAAKPASKTVPTADLPRSERRS